MDSTKYMIIIKDKICTNQVKSCVLSNEKNKYNITFTNNRMYSYAKNNVIIMKNPSILHLEDHVIVTSEGRQLCDIEVIYQFENDNDKYWHIIVEGISLDYKKSSLNILKNTLSDVKSKSVLQYLIEVSSISNIKNGNDEIVLKKNYERLNVIPDNRALCLYLNPDKKIKVEECEGAIFPFGCNQSQYKAVKSALANQLSVIQGPPGTGKTQTILNIIANLIIRGKTVIVVSNNNSATQNVLEKFSKSKYGMNFMVASLGSADNKNSFIKSQTGQYPNLLSWECEHARTLKEEAIELANQLQRHYQLQEELAKLKEKRYEIEIEFKHFKRFKEDTVSDSQVIKMRRKVSSKKVIRLWTDIEEKANTMKSLSIFFKIKCTFLYGITNWNFFKQDLSHIIIAVQDMFYEQTLLEIDKKIEEVTQKLKQSGDGHTKQLEEKSLAYVKDYIAKKYNWRGDREIFSKDDLYKNSSAVLNEYPIVLSTTFSALTSLNWQETVYDYVIMDEASQVDIATGALALSCAKNAVIVGDLKQLPNVVTAVDEKNADRIREHYNLNEAYDFSKKSFLKSIVELIPSVPSTLLKEHYRCHPRIIQFCNQKFYNNELVIMTDADNSSDTLKAIKTVPGNHARGNYNQRQIDVIKEEVIPKIDVPLDKIGIIAPYNDQVKELHKQIPEIDAATVHKYQGREKDVIIISTVDNQIRDFTDDPYLLNVAISRAKKKLILIVSHNDQERTGNIIDLISYIQYNNMEVVNSKVYSIFDYLYSQYRDCRWQKLKKYDMLEYESENLTYSLLMDIMNDYPNYGIVCHQSLSTLIGDVINLSNDELRYAMNPLTHVDFVIFNKFSKQPVLAVETDGYVFHKEGTIQHKRDQMKNRILETCGIPLIRLRTNESNERDRIIMALEKI